MTWVPYLRKLSRDYDKMIISTFEGMEALYSGFHCELEFDPVVGASGRAQDWRDISHLTYNIPEGAAHIKPIKEYKVDGEYFKYGTPDDLKDTVLLHARGISVSPFKNWAVEKWAKLAGNFQSAVSIGSKDDIHVPGTEDARGIPLGKLMDLMASANLTIGQISGVMHLATLCGCPHVAWGYYSRPHFGETLEKRMTETWNPLLTSIIWVGDTWDPEPEQIMEALEPRKAPDLGSLSIVHDAFQSGQYIVSVAYIEKQGGKAAVMSKAGTTNFPDAMLDQAAKQMARDINGSIAKVKAERAPVSWH